MVQVNVDVQLLKDAMFAISKLQGSLGIDLVDEDGYGGTYFALEKSVKEAEQ